MQCIVIGPVCVFACFQRAGGPAVSEHRETQTLRALAVVSYIYLSKLYISERFFINHVFLPDSTYSTGGASLRHFVEREF